jgi:hypothetical protein
MSMFDLTVNDLAWFRVFPELLNALQLHVDPSSDSHPFAKTTTVDCISTHHTDKVFGEF